jgi:hypothetical protein
VLILGDFCISVPGLSWILVKGIATIIVPAATAHHGYCFYCHQAPLIAATAWPLSKTKILLMLFDRICVSCVVACLFQTAGTVRILMQHQREVATTILEQAAGSIDLPRYLKWMHSEQLHSMFSSTSQSKS